MDPTIVEEAKIFYLNKMKEFLNTNEPPSGYRLRQKHTEYSFEAVDMFRKKSVGEANTWKLEKDISDIYGDLLNENKRKRKTSVYVNDWKGIETQ